MDTELHIGGRPLPAGRRPWIMGIVNITPDSFSDGGRHQDARSAVAHAQRLVQEGADLLDLGGESSRPGATPVSPEEERDRVLPVLRELRPQIELPLSVDTTKSSVARAALECGADMINDISALRFDADLAHVLADSDCSVVLMHMRGEPRTMQDAPHYEDVVTEVAQFLQERVDVASTAGIESARLLLDPGIGFGKRLQDNLALLHAIAALRRTQHPVLVGASRKRFLGTLLDEPDPGRRLEGDLAVNAWCQLQGVDILRVHDVRAAHRLRQVLWAIQGALPRKGNAEVS